MAVTLDQIEALNQAISDGVRQVTLNGQTVTYNTSDSLIRARDDLQTRYNREQETATGTRRNKRVLLQYAGRGY
jgi:hypothetical protein